MVLFNKDEFIVTNIVALSTRGRNICYGRSLQCQKLGFVFQHGKAVYSCCNVSANILYAVIKQVDVYL